MGHGLESVMEALAGIHFPPLIQAELPTIISHVLESSPRCTLAERSITRSLESLSRFQRIGAERITATLQQEYRLVSYFYMHHPAQLDLFEERQYHQILQERLEQQGDDATLSSVLDTSAGEFDNKYKDIVDTFTFIRERYSFAEQERIFAFVESSQDALASFPHFSRRTIENIRTFIETILHIPLLRSGEFPRDNLYERDIITPLALSDFISWYQEVLTLLGDPTVGNVFESLFQGHLMSGGDKVDTIVRIYQRLTYFGELAQRLTSFSSGLKSALLYSCNYLQKQDYNIYLGDALRDGLITVVEERKERLQELDSGTYYGLFMNLSLFIRSRVRELERTGEEVAPHLILPEIPRTLDGLMEYAQPLSVVLGRWGNIDTLLTVEERRDLTTLFNTQHHREVELSDQRPPGHKRRKTLVEKLRRNLFEYNPQQFFNQLSLFYFSLSYAQGQKGFIIPYLQYPDERVKVKGTRHIPPPPHEIQSALDTLKDDAMGRLFLNYFLKRWNLRDSSTILGEDIRLLGELTQKGLSKSDKFKIALAIQPPDGSDFLYNGRLAGLLRSLDNADEIIECASIESPYTVLSKLGQGAAGATYKVHSSELRKHRALKVIPMNKVNREEAALMATLEGKDLENIVQIYEASDTLVEVGDESRYAIVMEYVDGKTLREIIDEGTILTPQVLEYSAQLLNGILGLRAHGITHRDLNPRNIKINSRGTLKILDFGIATTDSTPEGKDARRYGVPDGSEANDIFSLGLMTYEMAAGEHLVYPRTEEMGSTSHAQAVAELKQSLYRGEGKLQSEYKRKIEQKAPPELQPIILACLQESGNIDSVRSSYLQAREDLRYYFMDRAELIQRVRELERK